MPNPFITIFISAIHLTEKIKNILFIQDFHNDYFDGAKQPLRLHYIDDSKFKDLLIEDPYGLLLKKGKKIPRKYKKIYKIILKYRRQAIIEQYMAYETCYVPNSYDKILLIKLLLERHYHEFRTVGFMS